MKEFDLDTLSECNGKEGRPVCIAHEGKVYDVSASRMWKTGRHMNRHDAGADLTDDIQAAPHGPEVLDRYPRAGILKAGKEPAKEDVQAEPFGRILERFPILRRHPHPMVVHFPIVFMMAPVLFLILSVVFSHRPFEETAFHCLGAGIIFLIPAIITGFFTWWINYLARPMRQVRIKISCSFLLLAAAGVAFLWRLFEPDVFTRFDGQGLVYFLVVLLLVPLVSVIGWYGASLSFPLEKGR